MYPGFQDRDAGRDANRSRPTEDRQLGGKSILVVPRPESVDLLDTQAVAINVGKVEEVAEVDVVVVDVGTIGMTATAMPSLRMYKSNLIMATPANTSCSDAEKQAAKGWGEDTAVAELNDEKSGEAQAWAESKGADGWDEKPVGADGDLPSAENGDVAGAAQAEPEPEEDKSKSYEDYLAEREEKRKQLGGTLQARKPNEGAGKKLPEGKAVERVEDEYMAGSGGKAKREKERKEKNAIVLDHDYAARERDSGAPRGGRGGRGRGRGDGFRGDRGGDRGGRGRGGRGDFRADFRPRGGRGGASPNVTDESAFPSLGA